MKNKSIWQEELKYENINKLEEDITTDVLIIGAGITGITTAYFLRNSNLNITIVDESVTGGGITSRTTGKLTFLQENIYSKLKENALEYYNSQKDAIETVEEIIKENNIECDYMKVDSYIYTTNEKDIKNIKKEEEMLKLLNIKFKTHDKVFQDEDCKYAISVENTAVFHPIKYLNRLKELIIESGIKVYENSSATSIKKEDDHYICIVNNKKVTAKKIVLASHYPYFLFPYLMPLKTYIEKSYISASTVKNIKEDSLITISKPIKSIRYHKDNLNKYFIYLNGSHNLCTKSDNINNFAELLVDVKNLNLEPEYIWSNHDIITEDSLPYIGFIDDNLLIGTGYNTWGMTNGTIAGKILSSLILNKKSKYKDLFDPKRNKHLKNILKYPLNISYNTKSFVENKVVKNKSWYKSNVVFEKRNGKSIAIYTDKNNKEHIVYNLCPHLKCSLIFNEVEKTWDCPCHGSRFDIDGKCIVGPSNKDIGYKKD